MLVAHLVKRHTARADIYAHHIQCFLDGDRIYLDKEAVYEVKVLYLELCCLGKIVVETILYHIVHLLGNNVRSNRNYALAAERYKRNYHVIVSAVNVNVVAAGSDKLCCIADVAACFLDSSDVSVLSEFLYSCNFHVYACASGNIVEDYRYIHSVCNCGKVCDKSALSSLVVIRCNEKKSVNAYSLGFLGKLDSIAGVVASRACNYWDPACCLFNSKSQSLWKPRRSFRR